MQKAPQQYNSCVMISPEAVSAADQAGQFDSYFFHSEAVYKHLQSCLVSLF